MPSHPLPPSSLLTANGALTPGATGLSAAATAPSTMIAGMPYDSNYDFFDPQHWMLDGLVDFNYGGFVPPLEGA